MSMNATDAGASASAILRATVDLPDPDAPAMPMMSGFTGWRRPARSQEKAPGNGAKREAERVSRFCIVTGGAERVNRPPCTDSPGPAARHSFLPWRSEERRVGG